MATQPVYYKSDFKSVVTLASGFTLAPFEFVYTSGRMGIKKYVAKYDGTKWQNCQLSQDRTKIIVSFDSHHLAPGPLMVIRNFSYGDSSMQQDGKFDVFNAVKTGIFLTSNPDDAPSSSTINELYTTEDEQVLMMLKGDTGATGAAGTNGTNGADGKSAYQLAVDNGYTGTVTEWLASLKGAAGSQGMKGDRGEKGERGDVGNTGAKGDRGEKGERGEQGAAGRDGTDGTVFYPTMRVDGSGTLIMDVPDSAGDNNMELDNEGYLCVNYPEVV